MAPPQWAYQIEHYVTEPDDELVCSICRAIFCDPAMCPCGHVFCKDCITKWLQNNRNCPICRKRVYSSSINQTVPTIVKNLILKLMLNCHNKSLGCKAQFSMEGSEAHVKECQYEFVQCKNLPCTDKLFRKDIVEHENKDCPHRYLQCEKCKCKMPQSTKMTEKHNCVKALRNLLKEKIEVIQKLNDKIEKLANEVETLKAAQETGRSRMSSLSRGNSLTSSTLSSISSDGITINIQDFDDFPISSSSSSSSSFSDMSNDSFYIFTNELLPGSNEESNLFSSFLDTEDNVANESNNVANEYCNAVTQTDTINDQQDESYNVRNSSLAHEDGNMIVEDKNSVLGEVEEPSQDRKPTKRKPTTEKPSKRRFRTVKFSTSDDDAHLPSQSSSKKNWCSVTASKDRVTGADRKENVDSFMQAGPSSSSAPVTTSRSAASDLPKFKNRSRSKSKQKRARQAENYVRDNTESSRVTITSGNPVFGRTLALLEQYNLESADPEWIPAYASHTGNTTSESDSSDLVESSNSDLSDDSFERKSAILDDSQHELSAISDFMNWKFDSTSDDDPDWRPQVYSNSEED